ncbi:MULTISPECIES: hypothetical protein [Actinomycetes]|uniref:hypothetical protein n=1 Tax=Actinomycetes TaxID=1760 RepID=UPI0001B5516F|nr:MULTISPECIES: hypothetical protein [Actinomycetes]EFL12398.1 predicted protein [Streptomyces sp. AA4]
MNLFGRRTARADTDPDHADGGLVIPQTVADATLRHQPERSDPLAELRALPVPPARGWAVPQGGRDHHVGSAALWQGTTTQLAGLFPFVGGSGARVRGVPIGHDLHTHEPIGLHPGDWLKTGLISNTGLWVQAQPGVGKSAFAKRLGTGLCAFGWMIFCPADVKGEYTALIRRLGGTVIKIGRGHDAINPLDPGPLAALLATTSGRERDALRESIRARQASLLEGLLLLELDRHPTPTERNLVSRAIDLATDAAPDNQPTIPEVRAVLDQAPQQLLAAARIGESRERYFDLVREVLSSFDLLVEGPLRGLFDRRSTARLDPGSPATSLDISVLDEETDEVVAAAMLCSWAWGASMIEARQTGHGRNILWIQDEAWRALRTGSGLVEKSDRLTRLNRHKGVASVYLTHSMDDLEALPSEEDRAKARGIAARCAIHVYGGLPASELRSLTVSLSSREADMLSSWQSAGTWVPGQRHPGRGLYLVKAGERAGLPVRMNLTPRELELYNTDSAFDAAPRSAAA